MMISEFKASLGYRVSSKTDRALQRNSAGGGGEEKKKRTKQEQKKNLGFLD